MLPCTVCGTSAPREDSFRDIVLHRCPGCDHCFTDVVSLDHLGEYDEAWESLHPNWFAHPHLELFELVGRTIDERSPAATMIDVGAGRGELLEYLCRTRPQLELTGLDISLKPVIDGVEIITGDIADVDLGGRTFDVVASLATIEHVSDVQQFAHRILDLLNPGGIAIVMTIDDRSILYAVARLLRRTGYRTAYERLYDRFHLNHFNTRSLRTLMERSGFAVQAHHHHNIPLRSVDMPTDSAVLRAGVWGMFAVGRLVGRTYEQTLVAAKS
jgi:SAM-dependent methyltransferase